MLKFGQVSIASKDFHSVYQVTDSIDFDKITMSEGAVANKADTRYTIGYEVEPGKVVPLYIKTPKNCWSSGVSRYNENSAWKMGFKVSEEPSWMKTYEMIWKRVSELVSHSLEGDLTSEWINPKLITWKEDIKTRFNGWGIPYNKYCDATGVLKIGSVYKQGSNHYLQVFLKECKYQERDMEFQSQLSDDEGYDTVH